MKFHCEVLKSEYYRVRVEVDSDSKECACEKAIYKASLLEDSAWKYLDCDYTFADCVSEEEWNKGKRPMP